MADTEKKFSELNSAGTLDGTEILAMSQTVSGSLMSVKDTLQAIANWFAINSQYTSALNTTSKTLTGAINELKQLISLIPQFSIEVVQTLPTEDISDTTIYLVPSSNPETENAYDEFIHVNNTWEQVGSTAVDLSAYYTKLEADAKYPVTFTNVAASSTTTKKVADVTQNGVTTSLYADDAEKVLKKILNEEHTVTGNPISFDAWLGLEYAKSCSVAFSPIQSGSGDPSPENVRPISGRDSVDVIVTGKNLLNINEVVQGGLDENTGEETTSTTVKRSSWIKVLPNTTLYWNGTQTRFYFYKADKTYISRSVVITNSTITTLNDCGYIRLQASNSNWNVPDLQLELGSTATDYEPYQGSTHTATFPSTVYGGNVDFVSGKAKSEWDMITLNGTEDWEIVDYGSNNNYFRLKIGNYGIVTGGMDNSMCDTYPQVSISGSSTDVGFNVFNSGSLNKALIAVRPSNSGSITLAQFKSALNTDNITVAYKLATPTEITLTPETIALLKGNNVLFTDGDNITLKYSADIKQWVLAQLQS